LTAGGRFRLAAAADADIEDILLRTVRWFGTQQHAIYSALIESAINLVANDPARPGSKDLGAFRAGMRSFPVALAAKRRGASAHVLFYMPDDLIGEGILIVRVLHRSMDPRIHLHETPD
jgi:plasmid stabilization system protein ParE